MPTSPTCSAACCAAWPAGSVPTRSNGDRPTGILNKSIAILVDAFEGKRDKEDALAEIISHFEWIETRPKKRPKVAIFGDLYVRDNRVMNQDLVRFIENNGGEVITTPYSNYAKMIAGSYFRKWFNEGKYLDVLSYRTLLATMTQMEKAYFRIFNRILGEGEFEYTDNPEKILAAYRISVENTGESMDNILKIHYLKKHYPDIVLFVQASPALCCASPDHPGNARGYRAVDRCAGGVGNLRRYRRLQKRGDHPLSQVSPERGRVAPCRPPVEMPMA